MSPPSAPPRGASARYPLRVAVDARLYLRWIARDLPLLWRLRPFAAITSGPVGFMHRLMSASPQSLMRFTPRTRDADAYLGVVSLPPETLRKLARRGLPMILRLDGLFVGGTELARVKNRGVRESYRRADAILFQSEFCRERFLEAFGPPPGPTTVIYNGAPFPRPRLGTEPPPAVGLPKSGRRWLLSTSRWMPHKRVDETIRCFASYARNHEYDLLIAGEVPVAERIHHERVHYLGRVHPRTIRWVLGRCAALLHLAWFDWCPNSVVEALVAGVPVICTNQGGTRELVRGSGIVLPNDPDPPDVRRVDTDTPPLNPELVHGALDRILEREPSFDFPREDLQIERVAVRYLNFIEQVIGR